MAEPIIKVRNLKKYFEMGGGLVSSLIGRNQPVVKAVDGVSFTIEQGRILGLAGESGSGKTTTGMVCVRLYDPTEGQILFEGRDIAPYHGAELLRFPPPGPDDLPRSLRIAQPPVHRVPERGRAS